MKINAVVLALLLTATTSAKYLYEKEDFFAKSEEESRDRD